MGSKIAHQLTMTHRGEVTEYGVLGKPWRTYTTVFRETKLFWISTQGLKFRKADGTMSDKKPTFSLDLKSVAPLAFPLAR